MKQAQIAGQIFVYILSLIIVSLVLLYGYKAIQDFRQKGEEVNLINFKNEFEKVIVKSTRYGDIKPVELSLSGKYNEVCLLDSFSNLQPTYIKNNLCICQAGCIDYNPLICDVWTTSTNSSNVFMIPMAEVPINIGPITLDGNGDGLEDTMPCPDANCSYLCIPLKNGKLEILLYGKGKHVFIRPR